MNELFVLVKCKNVCKFTSKSSILVVAFEVSANMKDMRYNIVFTVVVSIYFCSPVLSSEGDMSFFYYDCVKNCLKVNCTQDGKAFTETAALLQGLWPRLMGWNCKEECRYHCMWRAVNVFKKEEREIPKFHGKWPFIRFCGVQEPGSAFASLLNLAGDVYMYYQLIKDKRFSAVETPLLLFWHWFFLVCINAWVWSTIFHTRDTPFTEFMDYACALSMVMALFIAAVVRLLYKKPFIAMLIVSVTVVFYGKCVVTLYSGKVDYEYNMFVNVVFGMLGTGLWMGYALGALCGKYPAERRYVWRLVVFCKVTSASVVLELFDFPPYWNVWDAHALWHMSTVPLPFFFFRFVIDDLYYIMTLDKDNKRTDPYKSLQNKLA